MARLPRLPIAQAQHAPLPRDSTAETDSPVEGRFGFRSDREVGMFRDDVFIAPLVGEWYDVLSTWLHRIRFDWASPHGKGQPFAEPVDESDLRESLGYLTVEFLDLAVVQYVQPWKVFFDMLNSSSKGRFMHHASARLTDQPYDEISGPKRKVTKAMRDARSVGKRTRYDNAR